MRREIVITTFIVKSVLATAPPFDHKESRTKCINGCFVVGNFLYTTIRTGRKGMVRMKKVPLLYGTSQYKEQYLATMQFLNEGSSVYAMQKHSINLRRAKKWIKIS